MGSEPRTVRQSRPGCDKAKTMVIVTTKLYTLSHCSIDILMRESWTQTEDVGSKAEARPGTIHSPNQKLRTKYQKSTFYTVGSSTIKVSNRVSRTNGSETKTWTRHLLLWMGTFCQSDREGLTKALTDWNFCPNFHFYPQRPFILWNPCECDPKPL